MALKKHSSSKRRKKRIIVSNYDIIIGREGKVRLWKFITSMKLQNKKILYWNAGEN